MSAFRIGKLVFVLLVLNGVLLSGCSSAVENDLDRRYGLGHPFGQT